MLPPRLTLQAARINCGLSVKEVAKIVNKDYQVILGYEENSEKIPVVLLIELSEIYQYPLDYIFLGKLYRLNSVVG
jgi:transcriptional regulator with XRE-family HTH domain